MIQKPAAKQDILLEIPILAMPENIRKPDGGWWVERQLKRMMDDNQSDKMKIGLIGDRMLTDVLMARLNGWYSVLVLDLNEDKKEGDVSTESWLVIAMRKLERRLFRK